MPSTVSDTQRMLNICCLKDCWERKPYIGSMGCGWEWGEGQSPVGSENLPVTDRMSAQGQNFSRSYARCLANTVSRAFDWITLSWGLQ